MAWSKKSSERPGLETAPITSVQGIPSADWVKYMTDWAHGNDAGLQKLLNAYGETFTHEHLTVRLDGSEVDFPLHSSSGS